MLGAVIAAATLALGGLIWLIRLEGRVNVLDRAVNALEHKHDRDLQAVEVKFVELREDLIRMHKEIREDLTYIRTRLDGDAHAG